MRYLDRLAEEAASRKSFTAREVIIIACFLPFFSAFFTFGGAHPLVNSFSDPASDRIGPWLGVVAVGIFWIGTLAFWAWAICRYIRRKKRQE